MCLLFTNLIISTVLFFTILQANISIGIATASNYVGDREVAWRIKLAAENLGWTVFLDENEGKDLLNKDLDWVICMLPENNFPHPKCPNYLTVFHPFNYLDEERKILSFYQNYDGFLLTINDRDTLKNSFESYDKEVNYTPFYPTVYSVPYSEVPLNNLVTMVPVWSNRLTEKKFRTLYRSLSKTGQVKFYGINKNKSILPKGYQGKIPFDGVSVIKVLQKHGIVLILHSDIHNKERIPSSRIFEAAAASTVIISDENAFVKKHFGDSVFYIDTSLSAKTIFKQIQVHLETIFYDPINARQMAKRAHQIFIKNFEMSDQLLKLDDLNQKIISKKRNQNV